MGDSKNGQQILEELRFRKLLRRTGLFILITAETSKDIVMGARENQPDGYIAKPITKAVLQKRLDALIEQRETLLPINKEIDQENYPAAITLCDQEIKRKSKYITWCLRTIADLYFRTGDFAHAQKIYEDVLKAREIAWARLGLGRVLLGQKHYDEAVAAFTRLADENNDMVEAYDGLAETYRQMGKLKESQKFLEKAVAISPLAILRQKQLGDICTQTQDVQSAATAFRQTVKLGAHSVHDDPDNYLQLGRCLSDLSEGDNSEKGKMLAKEAITTLEKANKRFDNADVKLQSLLIETRVHKGQNNLAASKKAFEKAQTMTSEDELTADAGLEMAKTLYRLEETDKAEKLLHKLAQKFENDKKVITKIEELLDEPVSLQKKLRARELNRNGINLFEQGKLEDAIKVFEDALAETPKHPALNLNLVQVLIKLMEGGQYKAEGLRKCTQCLDSVKHIPSQHRQYKRYQFLCKKIAELS
jgi:tetratricopeptide (TPR) repeat protein